MHYLLVDPANASILNISREADGTMTETRVTTGELTLDPPGLVVPLSDFFPPR